MRQLHQERGHVDISPTQAHAAAKYGFLRQADYVACCFWGARRTDAGKAGNAVLAAECRARSRHHGRQKLPGAQRRTTYPRRTIEDLEDNGTYNRIVHSESLWAEYETLVAAVDN